MRRVNSCGTQAIHTHSPHSPRCRVVNAGKERPRAACRVWLSTRVSASGMLINLSGVAYFSPPYVSWKEKNMKWNSCEKLSRWSLWEGYGWTCPFNAWFYVTKGRVCQNLKRANCTWINRAWRIFAPGLWRGSLFPFLIRVRIMNICELRKSELNLSQWWWKSPRWDFTPLTCAQETCST